MKLEIYNTVNKTYEQGVFYMIPECIYFDCKLGSSAFKKTAYFNMLTIEKR